MSVPLTPMVKRLIILNVAVWLLGVVILPMVWSGGEAVTELLGLVPALLLHKFYVWQLFTYMFLHARGNVFHIIFNMLSLWWFGAELEQRWGQKFFLTYYLVCGVGAGLIYALGTIGYGLITGNPLPLEVPLVGASGATYGLLLAYGLLFGERMIYFMMLFPMKAKVFVLLIGGIELITLLDSGVGSQVANLAHLGGLAVGFVFLNVVARLRARERSSGGSKRGRRLKLVVDNERQAPQKSDDKDGPKYWN
jgi:membrane associated rhomboid family serine protease